MTHIAFLLLMAAPVALASAQVPQSDYLRDRCASAVSRAASSTHAERVHAVLELGVCPNDAHVIRDVWNRAPTDPAEIAALLGATSRVHDRRILSALMRLAWDAGQPRIVREAAMHAMAGYIDPSVVAYVRDDDPQDPGSVISVSYRTHADPSFGSERPTHGERRSIISAWESLRSDRDHVIAGSATYLLTVVAPRLR